MVPEPELSAPNISRWAILLCVLLLASACGDEPVEETASCQCPDVETMPAIAGYQTPYIVYTRSAPGSVTPSNQVYMMQPQTFVAEPAQQGWGLQPQRMPAAGPAGEVRQHTFMAPQNTAFQNQQYQQNTTASPWAIPDQSAAGVQQFQNTQRPWGPPATPVYGNQSRAGKDTSSQQPNQYQWGVPVGGGYYYGQGPDPYGATQGAGYPGYVR